jgi:hypothetical protein
MITRRLSLALTIGLCLSVSTPATATPLAVVNVTPSSTWFTYDVNNLINGSGLSGNLHDGIWQHKWMTNQTSTGWLVFDLGPTLYPEPYLVESTTIWNYGPGCCGNERSTKDLRILTSWDGITYSPVGDFVLSQPTTDPFGPDIIPINRLARYIRFDLNSNYGPDSYIGLSEVQFNGQVPMPDPGSTLLLLGMGIAALQLGRKRMG